MRFSDVRHQERAVSVLRRALRSGRTPHAYLLEGPEGVGKELAGRALAARLLCDDDGLAPDADACGRCNSCRLVAADNHPDFHLIHRGLRKFHPDRTVRERKGLFLAVDLVRHFVIQPAGVKPTQGRRRVFLFRDAERMNEEAQNALLKTLEEPPGSACLILVTASGERLLPTIRSRCQRVAFDLLPREFVISELRTRLKLPAEQAQVLGGLAGGRLGVALRWHQLGLLDALEPVSGAVARLPAGDPEAFGQALVETATELATRAVRLGGEEEDTAAEDDEEDDGPKSASKTVPTDALRDALKLVLMLVAALYRDELLDQIGAAGLRLLAERPGVERLAAANAPERLEACVAAVNQAERMLDRNVAPKLVGEWLAVALLGEAPVA